MTSVDLDIGKDMRLLYVTPRFLPLMGGVENHVHQVASRLADADVEVTVLTSDLAGDLPPVEVIDGIEVRRVRAWPAGKDYYFAPGMYRTIAEGNWDVVHVQSYHTFVAPLAMLASWRARLPYVVTFHGGGHSSRLRTALRRQQRAFLRPLLARAARLVAVARFEIDLFAHELRLPTDRFVLIPNGADLPTVDTSTTDVDSGLLVSIGRLERYKGHQRAIAALPFLLQHRPDVRLWIAGTGPYEPELRRLASELGVADRVEIRAVPPTARAQLAQELSRAGLVVLLSEYETHPIAAIEALALGCRVLVADSSGLRELADDGLARAISLQSTPAQVAEAMLAELGQPRQSHQFHLPTWDNCTHSLHHLYHSLLVEKLPCVS